MKSANVTEFYVARDEAKESNQYYCIDGETFNDGVRWAISDSPVVLRLENALREIKEEKLNFNCGNSSEERWMALAHYLKECAEEALEYLNEIRKAVK